MNVGYNCRYLERPHWTGTERYLYHLLQGIEGMAGRTKPVLFGLDAGTLKRRLFPPLTTSALMAGRSAGWRGNQLGRFDWDVRAVGNRANAAGVDVFHGTSFTLPRGLRMPAAVTIFDLAFLRYPGFYSLKENLYLRWAVRGSINAAQAVITISEFSKREIVALLRIDPGKVFAIPLGVRQGTGLGPGPADDVLRRHGLKRPYLLTVSTVTPRKNLKVLLRAMAGKELSGAMLCVAGRDGYGAAAIKKFRAGLGLESRVVFTGPVSPGDLATLVANSSCTLVPSRYEGFGLPVLEAMAAGVPVVAANAAALPEVVGPAGLLADPGDPGDWVIKIGSVLQDRGLRQQLRQSGLERARAFTWQRTAERTCEVYERIKS